jgi:hypothetical protein
MTAENINIKRQRFEKIASKRVQKILDDINVLSNCSNKNNYEYSDADVKKMMNAIKAQVKQLEVSFTDQKGHGKQTFKF